ncbi:MAG: 2-oxo acid dehydrogenase subunit E2 [Pseudomonadota bacterium]|jgi:2-oxoisovalerate dehydrogenase E2 component (dihydrolipoyl transacylase)
MSDFILPDIGEGIVECEVVEWRVQEGDLVEEDQPVVEVMTDKALVEITASEAGTITQLYVAQGQIAKVHAPLYAYRAEGEPQDQEATRPEQNAESSDAPAEKPATQAPSSSSEKLTPTPAPGAETGTVQGKTPASPAVRRLVREHGLALNEIAGSGKEGRVLKEDVLRYLEMGQEHPGKPASAGPRVEPLRGVRAAMARQMVASATTIPHFQYGEEIDVTDLLALRERLKVQAEAQGERLTLMPFFMKAMALAVAEYPILNAQLNDRADELHYYPDCNIGMAVDSKVGLMVPNVKDVGARSLLEVAAEVTRLTQSAREGRVEQADLKGGTITISNIGALGGTYAAPIINAPEAAIVAIGKTQWLPRFDENGDVSRRAIMTVTWAGDHRFIDGGTIARFCNHWKASLESPESMLLHLR